MGNAVFRASTQGYRRTAGRLSRTGREVQPLILEEFRANLSQEALAVAIDAAPSDTGLLADELEAPVSSRGGSVRVTLRSPVRDPRNRFPYTDVTRFGHRKKIIRPRKSKMLRFQSSRDGRWIQTAQVRGYKPASDWVEDAEPGIVAAVDRSGSELGRAIVTRLL